jgi:ribosomal protein L12E/L44/L45/RPP1/RPP2
MFGKGTPSPQHAIHDDGRGIQVEPFRVRAFAFHISGTQIEEFCEKLPGKSPTVIYT